MKWICQAYRGMDTYRGPVEVEADSYEKATRKAMNLVPFGDMMSCEPVEDDDPCHGSSERGGDLLAAEAADAMSTEAMKDLARRMAVQLAADTRTAQRLLEMIDLWPIRESAYETRIRELEEHNAQLESAAIAALDACLLTRNRNAGR